MSANSHNQQSPVDSTRSSCSSHTTTRHSRRLSMMDGIPSVQQLAAVDNAVEEASFTGYRPNLVLEPDLILALEKRVRSYEVTGANNGGSGVGGERRTSFSGSSFGVGGDRRTSFSGSFPGVGERRTSFSGSSFGVGGERRRSSLSSMGVMEERKVSFSGGFKEHNASPQISARSSTSDRGRSPREGHHYPGLLVSSEEASYQRIPTQTETDEEEEQKKNARRKRRRTVRSSRDERLANLPEWRIRGQEVIQGFCFQCIMALLIISNSLVIGFETDITTFEHWDDIENLFLFAFLGELIIKLVFQGVYDLFDRLNPDFNWNVFDSFIVTLGLVDFVVGLLTTSKGGSFATLFRIIRLLRILRIIRIVKFLKQLYLLAVGLAEAAQAVFWVTILMTFILYVCSIIMVKTVGRPPDNDPNQEFLQRHFGGVMPSMLTLFVLMSSPNLPVYQDQVGLLEERPLLALFFVCFIVFGSFGMLALLTGVISESMFEKNNMRKEEERIEHEKLRMDVGIRCEELYERMDKNEDDEVNIEDLQEDEIVDDMARTFESAGVFVTSYDLCTMLQYLDVDGSGTINKDEFMRGMLVLAEGLRPISVQEVHHDVGVCRVKLERVEAAVDSMMVLIHNQDRNKHSRKVSPRGSHAEFGTEASSHTILENISKQIQDFTKIQKQMCTNFLDLDGKMQEISQQVQTPLGEDFASLKAYLNSSLQELGEHIVRQCSKERTYTTSRSNDADSDGPLDTQNQTSCTLANAQESGSRAGRATWPALSFCAAGSSAEQAGMGTSSGVLGVEQKFFTFDPDEFVPPTMQPTEEMPPKVVDVVMEAAKQPSTSTASAASSNLPGRSTSTMTSRAADAAQGLLMGSQVQELINWQQHIETELRRVSQMAQQEGGARAVQAKQPATSPRSAQSAQSAQAAHSPQVPEVASLWAVPVQGTRAAQGLQALQSQTQVPSTSAALAPAAEPVRHASALQKASLVQLLDHMRELVSNHEAFQTEQSGRSQRSNEVLDYDDCQPPSV